MAQQERAVRTRQAILAAAGEVFAERGYAAAAISEVYSRAGLTKGAFYFHFGSKAELAQAVLDEQVDGQIRYLEVPPGRRSVKLQELLDVGFLVAHRLTFDRMLQGSIRLAVDQGHDTIDRRVPYQAWIDVHARLLGEARDRGELLSSVDVLVVARLIVGAFSGTQLLSEVMCGRADVEQQVASLFVHLVPSIAVPAVLAQLDLAPDRGKRLMAEAQQLEEEAGG